MKYDAIVVGGSFAGLAAAAQLLGKVLLIDRKEIGTGQTSAFGTNFWGAERLGAMDSILQIHDHFVIRVGPRVLRYNLSYPFCTFDYKRMCDILLARVDAEIVIAHVRGLDRNVVVTDKGSFESDLLIDASGWRATLASSLKKDYVDRRTHSFGLETIVPHRAEGLHFWVDRRRLENGVTWVFPCGEFSRIGIGSYEGRTDLKDKLEEFLVSLGLKMGEELHGGFYPWALREPTVGNIFTAGDSAGHCFGLSGEGIRSSLYFGQVCGQIVQKVIDGEISRSEAQSQYRAFMRRHHIYFKAMLTLQKWFASFPDLALYAAGRFIGLKPVLYFLMWQYWKGSDPSIFSCSTPRASADQTARAQMEV